MFTATAPFVFFAMIAGHPSKLIILVGLALMFVMFICRQRVKIQNPVFLWILSIQAAYCLLAVFLQGLNFGIDLRYINLSLQFVSVAIVYIYISSYSSIHLVGKSSIFMMSLMGGMGAVAFFLGITGLVGPLTSIQTIGDRTVYSFLLTYSPAAIHFSGAVLMRVAGFFAEPGDFAFYLVLALLLNKLYAGSRKIEWLLIFSGLFTLSVTFYISIFLYLSLYYRRLIFKPRPLLAICIFLMALFAANAWVSSNENDEFGGAASKLLFGRFLSDDGDSEKIIKGDNRSDLISISLSAFMDSPFIGHGESVNENSASKYHDAHLGANLFAPLAVHGIIGAPILFLAYLYWTFLVFRRYDKLDSVNVVAWIIFTVNLIPKPQIYSGLYGYFVIIFLIEATRYRLSVKN
jgi:hypothetical protein